MNKKVQNGTLKLTTKTWDKDNNGLFNYYTKTIKKTNKEIQNSTSLIRNNLEIKSASNELIKENEELLIKKKKKSQIVMYTYLRIM